MFQSIKDITENNEEMFNGEMTTYFTESKIVLKAMKTSLIIK